MISTSIQFRFNDFDMGGHVHNAAYLHYFETARIHFFMSAFGGQWDWKKEGLIIKKNTIEYNSPIFISDEIRVAVECNQIGTKSFTLTYSVLDGHSNLKAYGESVVVSYDYNAQTTTTIPEAMLAHLKNHFKSA